MPSETDVQEIELSTSIFSANLDILMTRRGMWNAKLADMVGVTREMVGVWRQGKSLPQPDNRELLAQVFDMTEKELFTVPIEDDLPPMLPISQWARREKVTVPHAKNLFEMGILKGIVQAGTRLMVPAQLRAPKNSKQLVRLARRPPWADAFSVNLDYRMRQMNNMQNAEMAAACGVSQSAVTHWRSGRTFPVEARLPVIAKKLGCTVARLIAPPDEAIAKTWCFRFGHASFEPKTDTSASVSEAA